MTIDDAYKIGDRMARPWQWATAVLATTVAGLLYVIITASVEADTSITADELTAKSLTSSTSIKE